MNLGRAFTFAFEDQDWLKKLGIAGLVMLIPLIGLITVMGWSLEVTRRVIRREPETLPDWSSFGDYLMNGLKMFVISLVYSLPIILLGSCSALPFIFAGGEGDSAMGGLVFIAYCFFCLIFIYSLVLLFFMPAAFASFAVTGELGTAFRFKDVMALVRAAPSAYLLVLLGSILAGFIGGLGGILCVIGAVFTYAYSFAVQSHLWGQAYNEAITAKGM